MSINKVIVSGNLTRDPELRQTASGTAVLGFSIAVNDRVKNPQTGEWENRPNFIDCTMWGSRAEAVSKYLVKGGKIAIEGHLRQNVWEKDGQKRTKIEIIVNELELMSRSEVAGGAAPVQVGGYGGYYQAPQSQPQQPSQPQYQQAQYQPQQQYQATNYAQQQYMAPQGFQQQSSDAASAVYDEDIPF